MAEQHFSRVLWGLPLLVGALTQCPAPVRMDAPSSSEKREVHGAEPSRPASNPKGAAAESPEAPDSAKAGSHDTEAERESTTASAEEEPHGHPAKDPDETADGHLPDPSPGGSSPGSSASDTPENDQDDP